VFCRLRPAALRLTGSAGLYAATALLTIGTLTFVLRLWHASLEVPLAYDGDALFELTIVKTIVHSGWYLDNPLLGAPFGGQLYDFPQPYGLHFIALKLLALFSTSFVVVANLFFLCGFVAIALTTTFALKRLGVSHVIATTIAILYAFLPYHLYRGLNHLFLVTYYAVPLVGLMLVRLMDVSLLGAQPKTQPNRRRRRFIGKAMVVCLVAGMSGLYYAFFTCLLLCAAAIWSIVVQRSRLGAAAAMLLVGTTIASLFVNLAPNVMYWAANGPNSLVAPRQPGESDANGLRLAQLLLPVPDHRLGPLRQIAQQYAADYGFDGAESQFASLGVVGAIGFLGLVGALVGVRAGPTVRSLAVLNLAAVGFATVGGIGSLFASLISPQIRATNRVSVFVAFFSLAAVALLLEAWRRRWAASRPRQHVCMAVLASLLVLGIGDQTVTRNVPTFATLSTRFRDDRQLAAEIEQNVGPSALIFQLPVLPFPEGQAVGGVQAYEPLRGFLHSETLRWSFGSLLGRHFSWGQELADTPIDVFLSRLSASGFGGIEVDRRGFPDRAASLEAEFAQRLGKAQVASTDGQRQFFSLRSYLPGDSSPKETDQLRAISLSPVEVTWGRGFEALEQNPTMRWRWAQERGDIVLNNRLPEARSVWIDFELLAGQPGTLDAATRMSDLTIDGDVFQAALRISGAPRRFSRLVSLPPGQHVLQLASNSPAFIPPGDPRRLVFMVARFRVTDDLVVSHLTREQRCAATLVAPSGQTYLPDGSCARAG
jgi:hypothetical protein